MVDPAGDIRFRPVTLKECRIAEPVRVSALEDDRLTRLSVDRPVNLGIATCAQQFHDLEVIDHVAARVTGHTPPPRCTPYAVPAHLADSPIEIFRRFYAPGKESRPS